VDVPQPSYASLISRVVSTASSEFSSTSSAPSGGPVFVLKTGTVLAVGNYQYQDGRITYTLANGGGGVVSAEDVDWTATTRVNSQRGVHMTLHGGHVNPEVATAGF